MKQRIMGAETEYHFSVLDPRGMRLDQETYVGYLMDLARQQLPHLRGRSSTDLFVQTGARFYVDCGMHPEWATPEVTNPWDAVRYLKAGNRVIARLAGQLEERPEVSEAVVSRCNVSYQGTRQSTFGRHESYGYAGEFEELPKQLIPFLVSRVIFGAGGLTQSPGIEFTLSPRSAHIVKSTSGSSTESRGLFHTKQESLSRGNLHRVHILCGDSQCSDLGCWLTFGTTALVIAAVEADPRAESTVQLRAPVEALHRLAGDLTCRTQRVATLDDGMLSALDLQQHYHGFVGDHLDAASMPEWAGEVHRRWGQTLERLEQAPEAVERMLDAPLKLKVFRDRARRAGFDWQRFDAWNGILAKLQAALDRVDEEKLELSAALIADRHGPFAGQTHEIKWGLRRVGMSLERLDEFLAFRSELQEIDTRWSQLGERGIFNRLEATCPSMLEHRVVGVDRLSEAEEQPPPDTRAATRGGQVRELAGKRNGGVCCSWECILDHEAHRLLDISDPFAETAGWQEMSEGDELSRLFDLSIEDVMLRRHFERMRRMREARREREPEQATLPF